MPNVSARRHNSTVYASIFRFDHDMLVNLHTYGTPASASPVLLLREVRGGRLFSRYDESFERCWTEAALPTD